VNLSYEMQIACNIAWHEKLNGGEAYVEMYPWWAMKIMHPKTIAHHALAERIYKKWVEGDYFLVKNDCIARKADELDLVEDLREL